MKLWKRASQFLAAHFPDAASAIEIERTLMVESLERSPNFVTTHSLIAEFSDLSHLSPPLVDRLASAILHNSQIRLIRGDEDVKKFMTQFLSKYKNQLVPSIKDELENLWRSDDKAFRKPRGSICKSLRRLNIASSISQLAEARSCFFTGNLFPAKLAH